MILRFNVLIVNKNKTIPIHILHREEERKHLKAIRKMKSLCKCDELLLLCYVSSFIILAPFSHGKSYVCSTSTPR